ncbi:MAG: hydroxyacylglutathione hydrolase [Oligoflexales bacterium]
MEIQLVYNDNSLRNYSYLIISDRDAICVDPFDPGKIEAALDRGGYRLIAIINTHEHFDHIRGNEVLASRAKEGVWAYKGARGAIGTMSRGLRDEEIVNFGPSGEFLRVIHTPGHTMGHICLLLHKESRAFGIMTGDTIFNCGVGNCRSGDPHILFRTVEKLSAMLGDEIIVYPGHDYTENNLRFTLSIQPDNDDARRLESRLNTEFRERHFIGTMRDERQANLFFMIGQPKLVDRLKKLYPDESLETPEDVFLLLRSLRDKW